MTSYMLGATVAHVMVTERENGKWRSLCTRGPSWDAATDYDPARRVLLHYDKAYPHWSDPAPNRPWCRWCVRRVEATARDVGLLP